MKITTDSGLDIDFNQIDLEYAKTIINSKLNRILDETIFRQDAQKELQHVQTTLDKAKARANLYADRWADI